MAFSWRQSGLFSVLLTQTLQQKSSRISGLLLRKRKKGICFFTGWSNNSKNKLTGTVVSLQQLGIKPNPQSTAETKRVCVCVFVITNLILTQIHDGRRQQQDHTHSFLVKNSLAAKTYKIKMIIIYVHQKRILDYSIYLMLLFCIRAQMLGFWWASRGHQWTTTW